MTDVRMEPEVAADPGLNEIITEWQLPHAEASERIDARRVDWHDELAGVMEGSLSR